MNSIPLLQTYFDTLNQSTVLPNHSTLLRTFYLIHSANQVSKIGKNQFWHHLPWFILLRFHPCFFARINVSLLVLEHNSQWHLSLRHLIIEGFLVFCSRWREFGRGRGKSFFITVFIVKKATTRELSWQIFSHMQSYQLQWFTLSPSSPGEPLGPAGPGSPTGPCTPSRPAGPWGPFSPWFWRKGSDPHYHRRLMKISV